MKNQILIFTFITFFFSGCSQGVVNPYVYSDLSLGLISIYPLDETTGTIAYDSKASNDFTNSGATVNQSGKIGTSYLFDGSASYLYRASDNNLSPIYNQSMSVWINRQGNTTQPRHIMSRSNTSLPESIYSMSLYDTGGTFPNQLRVIIYDGAASQIVTYTAGSDIWTSAWNHVVFTRGGAYMSIYLNGVRVTHDVASFTEMGQSATSNVQDMIGLANNGFWFNGYIDQVIYWNRPLTQEEVLTLNNSSNGLAYSSW